MEAKKKVIWSPNAMLMVGELYDYLTEVMGDFKADEYISDLMDFGHELDAKSTRHPYCRNQVLQSKGYRCAVFRKKYLVIYAVEGVRVSIHGVIHVSRSPSSFEELVE